MSRLIPASLAAKGFGVAAFLFAIALPASANAQLGTIGGGRACAPRVSNSVPGYYYYGSLPQHNVAPLGGIGNRFGSARWHADNGIERGRGFWFRYRWSDYQPWRNDGTRAWSCYSSRRGSSILSGISLPSWVDERETKEEAKERRQAARERRWEKARLAAERAAAQGDPARDTSDPVGRAFTADSGALVDAGWKAFGEGRHDDAIALLKDACIAAPGSLDARVALVVAASGAGRDALATHSAVIASGLDAGWRSRLGDAALAASAGADAVAKARELTGAREAVADAPVSPVVASTQ
jgi:hypothetical protein